MSDFTLRSVRDFQDLGDALGGIGSQWWRGHADHEWGVRPAIHRPDQNGALRNEPDLCQKFRAGARVRHANCPEDDSAVDWLLLMQHYGVPTRILDWSESLLVALYFAVEDPTLDDRDGAIWALRPGMFNKVLARTDGLYVYAHGVIFNIAVPAFNPHAPTPSPHVAAFQPKHSDLRMMIQSAVCTIHHDPSKLEDHRECAQFLSKVVVPGIQKKYWRAWLDVFGIKSEALFPDLASFAVALRRGRLGR